MHFPYLKTLENLFSNQMFSKLVLEEKKKKKRYISDMENIWNKINKIWATQADTEPRLACDKCSLLKKLQPKKLKKNISICSR